MAFDEHQYEQAAALEERARQAGVDAMRQRPVERPRVYNGERLCLDCDDPIEVARLKAQPGAVRCVACQYDHERRVQVGR